MKILVEVAAYLIAEYDSLSYHERWQTILPCIETIESISELLPLQEAAHVNRLLRSGYADMNSCKRALTFVKEQGYGIV